MARKLVFCVLLMVVGLVANAAGLRAAELLMFEDSYCSWCRRWHVEVGPSYPNTAEGQRAPLRRMHIADQRIAGVELAGPIRATPTFVVVDDGREVGRIVGYPGDFFYPRLEELLQRLPPPMQVPAPVPARRAGPSAAMIR
jgi:protein-disulfide isomerase